MKVTFYCNSGANIHSCREEEMDTVEDLGLDEGEWEKMSEDQKYKVAEEWAEDQKYKVAEEWANDRLEIGFKEGE